MKIPTYLLAFLLFGLWAGCSFEEENIFDDSAAVRMEKTLENARELLISAPNGWIMEYFPTDTTEGYTFWMEFDASSKVVMKAKNRWTLDVLTTDTCIFDLVGDDGPVLTFPVAGNFISPGGLKTGLFHLFSNPSYPLGGNSLDGYGLGGDYEFIIQNLNPDQILLKGKKRKTTIRMVPLPSGMTAGKYFDEIDSIYNLLYANNNHVELLFVAAGDTLALQNNVKAYGEYATKYVVYASGTDPALTGQLHAFIITPSGIKFHSPLMVDTLQFQDFRFTDDLQKLVCTDNAVMGEILGTDPVELLLNTSKNWNIHTSMTMGVGFDTIYDKILANCQAVYREKLTQLYFRYNSIRANYTLTFVSGKYTGNFDLELSVTQNGMIRFTYAGTGDKNASIYLTTIDGFDDLLKAIDQYYLIKPICGLNLTFLKFQALNDATMSFYVNL